MRILIMLGGMVAVSAVAADKPGLAALNIKAERGVDASLAALISEAILSELKLSGRFASVIGPSDIQAMINIEQQKQTFGCDEDACLAQLGGALGVPYLLSGSLGSVGGRFMLNVKIIQVEEARVAERLTTIFNSETALVDGLKKVLNDLIVGALPALDPPAAEAKPATTKTSQVKVTPTRRRMVPWISGGLASIGLGLAVSGYLSMHAAQADYDAEPTVATGQSLEKAMASGNGIMGLGLGAVGAGVAAWVWLR